MTTAMITPQNAPRDSTALEGLSRAMRFRLALSCSMFMPDSPEEASFIGLGAPEQANELLGALNRWSQANGGNGAPQQQAAPPPTQQQQQQPAVGPPGMQPPPMQQQAPPPMQQQPMQGAPPMQQQQQMQPPPMQAPPPMQTPPPMQAPPPIQQQAPPRQPVTATDPGNVGGQPQPQQPQQAPATGAAGSALLGAVQAVQQATADMLGKVNTLETAHGPLAKQVTEMHQVLMGMNRTQQSLAVLVFMIAEETMGMNKAQLAKMVAAETQESLSQLLNTASGGSGKA